MRVSTGFGILKNCCAEAPFEGFGLFSSPASFFFWGLFRWVQTIRMRLCVLKNQAQSEVFATIQPRLCCKGQNNGFPMVTQFGLTVPPIRNRDPSGYEAFDVRTPWVKSI